MSGKTHSGKPSTCPCGSGRRYDACCGPLHAGAPAPDAAALMRSRYCAYVMRDEPYLLATWHRSTRPARLDLGADDAKWLGLEIRRHAVTGADAAIVEFVARCRTGGRAQRLHETSRFVREDGRWTYVDGEHWRSTPPVL
ncbi:MAG TPA: YchJ family metal-binding protein [Casimicrobiaceae bacterium]|nr:YchJ family metal-binding protein [Casimicrobiaceae bacterium]